MSLANVKGFIQKLKDDEELRNRVNECNTNEEKFQVAKDEGFDFTVEEFKEVYQDLTDDELEAISGGSRSHEYRGFV